jgi:hypothetical protein
LYDTLLAFAVARHWPEVLANAVEPGWVPTKMGGRGAPDDLGAAPKTQGWLAGSDDADAAVSGEYFYHMRPCRPLAAAREPMLQDRLLEACAAISGVVFPSGAGRS